MADVQPQGEVYRDVPPEAMDAWHSGADADRAAKSSPAIADLAPPADDSSMSGLVSSLTALQRKKVGEDTRMSAESDDQQARDRAVRNHAFQMEGVAASEMPKPWDADKQHKKWETDPIEGFGSMGGLFAMVASAFTKAPMENAMNGLAGAINSTKEANEQGYQRAYDAFKENVKLADQRFKTQHELYTDALQLGTADAAASDAKFRHAAVKFGDSQMLMLAEHGMIKEIYELQASRAQAHEAMVKSADAIDLHTVQKAAVNAIKMNPPQTGDPVQDKLMLAAQVQRVYDGGGKYGSAEQEAVGRYVSNPENMKKNPQEFADGLAGIHEQFVMKAPNIEGYRQAVAQEEQSNGGQPLSPERNAQLQQMFGLVAGSRGGAAGGGTSTQARVTQEVKEIQEKEKAKGHDISLAEAEKIRNQTVQVPSAHDRFQSDVQYDKVERMKDGISKVEGLLAKHKFITGIGGTLTRPLEAVSNILGSNETDRKQFERDVLEIKEWGQSALMDRSGRPLSSEAAEAGKIFAGLKPGDTTANTLRAYMELRPILAKLQEQIKARGQGKGPVSGGGETPAAPSKEESGKEPLWKMAPVKGGGKQSSVSDAPPVSGARKAPDGNWYVDDPKRPGKYLQVQVG
jgi:hypothetical protein